MNAQAAVLDLIFGRWRSQILHAGVRLDVFDTVGDEPTPADRIAQDLSLDPALCYRLLRALGAIGLLREDEDRRFSLTEAGRLLRRDNPQSLRAMTLLEEGPEHYALWTQLTDMVRDGRQNAFVRHFGRMAFDHAAADPDYGDRFNDAMSSYSNVQSSIAVGALRRRGLPAGAHLCDIAGGYGHLMASLLAAHPSSTGTVFDLPAVVGATEHRLAPTMGVGDRCTYVGGDMFVEVPRADCYFLKLILHDWNDDECVGILRNIHRASGPDARVFIVEHLITDPRTPHFSKLFDVHMMCWGTGRERSAEEYARLLAQAGWMHVATWFDDNPLMGLVEGAKA